MASKGRPTKYNTLEEVRAAGKAAMAKYRENNPEKFKAIIRKQTYKKLTQEQALQRIHKFKACIEQLGELHNIPVTVTIEQ